MLFPTDSVEAQLTGTVFKSTSVPLSQYTPIWEREWFGHDITVATIGGPFSHECRERNVRDKRQRVREK
jgi:hypothetical protein